MDTRDQKPAAGAGPVNTVFPVPAGTCRPATDTGRAAAAVAQAVSSLRREKERLLVAIDGRAAAGKSTLAARLADLLHCPVVHADDFYLQPAQRTPERYQIPGGNLDYERLLAQVILPWKRDGAFFLQPYDAHTDTYGPGRRISGAGLLIVEGSYSTQPVLRSACDLCVFLSTDPETQLSRIAQRNGRKAVRMFREKWIPLEEYYFSSCRTEEESDLCFIT